MSYVYDDGGRRAAGFKGEAGDCVTRAIAIATEKPYREVYDALWSANSEYASTRHGRVAKKLKQRGNTPRSGVFKKVFGSYLKSLGWTFTPTMHMDQDVKFIYVLTSFHLGA
jgi:hypothetical protein